MNRKQRLTMADAAATRAASLARDAESCARHDDFRHKVAPLAAAGALWGGVARAPTTTATPPSQTIDKKTED